MDEPDVTWRDKGRWIHDGVTGEWLYSFGKGFGWVLAVTNGIPVVPDDTSDTMAILRWADIEEGDDDMADLPGPDDILPWEEEGAE